MLLAVFTLFALYSLVVCKRAMDYGVEKSLRYAAVHGGTGAAGVITAYNTAAGNIWGSVGTGSTVTVTPAAFKAGDTVQVTATYYWAAPAVLKNMLASLIFIPVTLSVGGSMTVVY